MTKLPVMADLCSIVRSVASQSAAWSTPLGFDPAERWARLLYADDFHDLWVLTWLPGQGTDVHDHHASASAFTVVRGSLIEDRPNSRGRLQAELLPIGFTRWVAPGAVHRVSNRERTPAVSVHAYSPPLNTMTSYDARRGRIVPRERTQVTSAPSAVVA